mgnify:FL=1
MKQIQAIYREEEKLKDLTSEERLRQHQVVIKPLVDALFAYVKQHQVPVGTQRRLAEAVTYLLNQERYLRVFLENSEVPMDNNASERAIRGFCIGRNYVFSQVMCSYKSCGSVTFHESGACSNSFV